MRRTETMRRNDADTPYLDRLDGVTYEPVFIMGDHRSGTTLLYQLLRDTNAFTITTAYQVIRYGELLANHFAGRTEIAQQELNREFQQLRLDTRVIDEVALNADTPEEYGLILHALTGQLTLSRKTLPAFDEICRKMQVISGQPDRRLLLKNPWDYGCFLDVHELFPRAKMVFIHRHPLTTINSQLKAMQKNWTDGNPYTCLLSPTFAKLQRRGIVKRFMRWATNPDSRIHLARHAVIRRAERSADYYLKNISRLPAETYLSVRYEDLCENADREIGRILDFLAVPPVTDRSWQGEIAPRPVRLLPGLARAGDSLARRFSTFLSYHHYGALPR